MNQYLWGRCPVCRKERPINKRDIIADHRKWNTEKNEMVDCLGSGLLCVEAGLKPSFRAALLNESRRDEIRRIQELGEST